MFDVFAYESAKIVKALDCVKVPLKRQVVSPPAVGMHDCRKARYIFARQDGFEFGDPLLRDLLGVGRGMLDVRRDAFAELWQVDGVSTFGEHSGGC